MSEHNVLSSEELDFIRQIFSSQLSGKPLHASAVKVEGGALADTLLGRLGQHARLNLEAHLDNYHMSFPLHLVEDELHSLQLELGAPDIYEDGATRRPWRLTLKKPLVLLDHTGAATDLRVHELAPDSLLVGRRGKAALPADFVLWLPLPKQEPLQVSARRIRQASGQRVAYSLQFEDGEHGERIRQFIFEQYRQQNPQLQASS